MRPKAIHQIHEACAFGDGISNGMFFIQRLMHEAGYESEIFCDNIDPRLAGRVRPFSAFGDREDCLTLLHYSIGTKHDDWYANLRSPRVLIYHNITPHEFFTQGSYNYRACRRGREQIGWWGDARVFSGAIADSEYNASELRACGYPSVKAISLLVDLDHVRTHPWNRDLAREFAGQNSLLFVGSLIEHKGQIDLVRTLGALDEIAQRPARLLLPGVIASSSYRDRIEAEIARLGLEERVLLLGKRSNEDLYAIFRSADVYVSLSQHEGFGMPLVEAMAFDLPVIGHDAASVAATMNGGGVVLASRAPDDVAAAIRGILEDPPRRTNVIWNQRRALARYERSELKRSLQRYLVSCGFDVDLAVETKAAPPVAKPSWHIEGPFDSTYSLALVNRELARALNTGSQEVRLISRDGPGPFVPNPEFLVANPDLGALTQRADPDTAPDVVLRNQYPPSVAGMRGVVRGFANYAWEESGFPSDYVQGFNSTLNVISVTSRFVAKTLRDNGVYTPIRVVGNGADHVVKVGHRAKVSQPESDRNDEAFNFLHVSSCFPRKGVDALLEAWRLAFTRADRVKLVIKTFPNPHNNIVFQLRKLRDDFPDHAPIELINGDLDGEAMRALYAEADAVVCPSRGEGFGLPLAEALVLGRAVITTGHGGQTDFCTNETAWLCDYAFEPAQSHVSAVSSVWAEPDRQSLADALRQCREASPEERRRRIEAGRSLVLREFSWRRVAERLQETIRTIIDLPIAASPPAKQAWITTWNTRCGVAAYARALSSEIDPSRLFVFANKSDELISADEPQVRRCWRQGWDDDLEELVDAILSANVDVAVVQFNFGFFRLDCLSRMIDRLQDRGILVFIVLHSTMDVVRPNLVIRLAEAREALSRCRRLLVHSVHDLNRLKEIGLVENVTLFPHGVRAAFAGDQTEARARLDFGADCALIASFGFLLPHKGLRELIKAFSILRQKVPNAHLLMLNALYPGGESETEQEALRVEIAAHDLEPHVTLETSFLEEAEIVERLAAADAVVFPYQHTQEASSGAVKFGIASTTPVICTPLPIFDDLGDAVHRSGGLGPEEIAAAIEHVLNDPGLRDQRRERQRAWAAAHEWSALSRRLDNLTRGELFDAQAINDAWRSPFSEGSSQENAASSEAA